MKQFILLALLTIQACYNKPISKPAVEFPKPITLSLFTQKVMDTCRAALSPGRKVLLADQIARIAETRISKREHQEAFILLVCIESRFKEDAKSKANAVGLAQVLPKYAQSFAADCNIPKIIPEDALSPEINLHLGACYFNQLLIQFNGNTTLALSGYNSGPGSPTTKKLGLLQEGHPETMAYISKITMLRELMNAQE